MTVALEKLCVRVRGPHGVRQQVNIGWIVELELRISVRAPLPRQPLQKVCVCFIQQFFLGFSLE